MARLFTSGHETNSFTSTDWSTTSGSPTLQTTTKHSGTYAFAFGQGGETTQTIFFERRLNAGVTSGTYYTRWYFYANARPGADKRIFQARNDASSQIFTVSHLTDGQLRITNQQDSSTSDSGATLLPMDEWVRLELEIVVSSTVGSLTLRMNGTQVAQLTNKNVINSTQLRGFAWGNFGDGGSSDHYWDDHAINNTSGSFQNSWPGPGKLAMIKPESDDTVAWTDATGTGTGNAGEVDDSPGASDDDTSYVTSSTANQEDRYNLTALPGEVPSDATIILVNVQTRVRGEGTSGTRQVRALLWDHNGTQTNGPTTDNNDSTTYQTDNTAEQFIFDGTGYTPANINDFDAGIEPVTNHATRLTNLWVYVEWIEAESILQSKTGVDSLKVGLTEKGNLTNLLVGRDTLVAGLSERGALKNLLAGADSLRVALAEASATVVVQIRGPESLRVGLGENTGLNSYTAAQESLRVGLSDVGLLLSRREVVDSLRVGLTEAPGTVVIKVTGLESLRVALAENSDLNSYTTGQESLRVGLSERSANTMRSALQDNLRAGLIEVGIILSRSAVQDSLRVALAEVAALTVKYQGADSLRVGVAEQSGLYVRVGRADSLTIGLGDVAALYSRTFVNEMLRVGLTEETTLDMGGGVIAISVTDSLRVGMLETSVLKATSLLQEAIHIGLTDSAAVFSRLARADQLLIGLSESARVLVAMTSRDTMVVRIAEGATGVYVVLLGQEAVRVGLQETSQLQVRIAAGESLRVGLTEMLAVYARLDGRDNLAVAILDSGSVADVTQLPSRPGLSITYATRLYPRLKTTEVGRLWARSLDPTRLATEAVS